MKLVSRCILRLLRFVNKRCVYLINKYEGVERLRKALLLLQQEREQLITRNKLLVDETYRLRIQINNLKSHSEIQSQ